MQTSLSVLGVPKERKRPHNNGSRKNSMHVVAILTEGMKKTLLSGNGWSKSSKTTNKHK